MDLQDAQFRQLLNAAPDATVIVDESGQIVFATEQMQPVFGYEPAELIGSSVDQLLPERYHAGHPAHRSAFFESPKPRPMGSGLDLYGRHRDGHEFPVEISLAPLQTSEGTLVSSAIRDVTARKQLERSLTGILETSLNEIYIFDPKTLHFLQVNEGARKNLGYTMDELRKLTPVDIKPEFTTVTFAELVDPLLHNPAEKLTFETIHQRKDGSTYPVEVHLQHSPFETSPVFVAIILDITSRKEFEHKLAEHNALLEKRVTERTEQLRQAKEIAENATATKSRFLAAASHDLRQPLQSLSLYLSVMNRQLEQPKQLEIGEKMRKSLDTMGELLDALLDISKLDSGSVVPEKRDIRVQELLDRVVTDNIQQAEEKGLQLHCTSDNCIVHSDPGLLERVIENFVTNAIRYTDTGGVTIECTGGDGIARIAVTDTGIGIPKNSLDNVFEEYYQLDNPVRDRRKGLGLGLSIVKHIARLLDHRLDVTSKTGEGSTFSVEVPFGTEVARVESRTSANATSRGKHQPIVLFIDDDPSIVDATTMLLESADIKVYGVLCGDDALAHITAGVRPDIVISDYRLPGYNGMEVIRRVRQATVEDLPSVLMTGDTAAQEIEQTDITNCALLHKPVDTDDLISLIERLTG